MRPFGCPVTILNTLDSLDKFKRKVNEGFLVGYSVNSKAFRVFNSKTRMVQETLHVNFLENKPNIAGSGPTWLFNIDNLTRTMNYQPVIAGYQTNPSAGFQDEFDADSDVAIDVKENESAVPVSPRVRDLSDEFKEFSNNSTNGVNAACTPVTAIGLNSTNNTNSFSAPVLRMVTRQPKGLINPILGVLPNDEEDVGVEPDFSNLETNLTVSPIPTTRVHKDHLVTQLIGDLSSAPQTKSMTRIVKELGGLTQINDDNFYTSMFSCFLSQEEPKGYIKLSKILVGLKLCRRRFFNSKCKRFGY
uniref:Retrovirus-related Pol polyprotein from transposon TNT 1-94 n=1 Tax=Tanacetum cinerariifolium TaxID=118510 RepID=A0A699IMR9_TANCI|nr:retrovirus-related Pol polyprotein from transposon TNT 1-94 [Tanacetum cinerariifolium]